MSIRKMINQNEVNNIKEWLSTATDINELFDGDTALCYAVSRGNLEIVKLLIGYEADVNIGSPLVAATYQCNFEAIKLLIGNGANVNVTFEDQNGFKSSLLGYTFERDYCEMATIFIENGADVNVTFEHDRKRYKPLGYALEIGNFEMATLLIKHGADVNITFEYDHKPYTPIQYAIEKGDVPILKLLLELGATVPNGHVLINAFENNNLEIAKLLIEHGVRPKDIYIANSLLRKDIYAEINSMILKKFETITSGSGVIYDTSALIDYSFIIEEILNLSNISHYIPNSVIEELGVLAKSSDENIASQARKVGKVLFELSSKSFDIIKAEFIDDRHKNESEKIQEIIQMVENWEIPTHICSSDDLFKMRVKHLNLDKVSFIY